MRCPSSRRGLTLAELTIYMSGLLWLTYAAYGMLAGTSRYLQIADASVEVEQRARLSVNRLIQDLSESNASQIVWDTAGVQPGLIFPSIRNPSGAFTFIGGGIAWQTFVCYYADQGRLLRKRKPISPTALLPSNAYRVSDFVDDPNLPVEVIANELRSFVATPGNGICRIDLSFENTLYGTNRFSTTMCVQPRN